MIKRGVFVLLILCLFPVEMAALPIKSFNRVPFVPPFDEDEEIKEYTYDEKIHGFRLFFKGEIILNGIVLREEDGKKVNIQERAAELVEKYKKKKYNVDNFVEGDVKISETVKYKAARSYFEAIRLQKNAQFLEAIRVYQKALSYNHFLKYQSDIYYRLGQCYQAVENYSQANLSFDIFINYSEKIIPESFYQYKDVEDIFPELIKKAEEICVLLDAGELGETDGIDVSPYTGKEIPIIYRRGGHPGFTLGKWTKTKAALGVGISRENGTLISTGITDAIDIGIGGYLNNKERMFLGYVPMSIFRSPENRLGIKAVPRVSVHEFGENEFKATSFGANVTTAYFITPDLSFFAGVAIPIYYKDNNTENKLSHYWRRPYLYGGVTFEQIVSVFGLSISIIQNEKRLEMTFAEGIRIVGWNFEKKELYIIFGIPLLF